MSMLNFAFPGYLSTHNTQSVHGLCWSGVLLQVLHVAVKQRGLRYSPVGAKSREKHQGQGYNKASWSNVLGLFAV